MYSVMNQTKNDEIPINTKISKNKINPKNNNIISIINYIHYCKKIKINI